MTTSSLPLNYNCHITEYILVVVCSIVIDSQTFLLYFHIIMPSSYKIWCFRYTTHDYRKFEQYEDPLTWICIVYLKGQRLHCISERSKVRILLLVAH